MCERASALDGGGMAVTATLRAIPEGNADTAAQPLLKGPLSAKVPIPLHGSGGSGVAKGPRNPNDKLDPNRMDGIWERKNECGTRCGPPLP